MGQEVITKRDLVEGKIEALDREKYAAVEVSASVGGVAFRTAMEVIEFAKLLASAQQAIPPVFRGNVGMCLGVTFQAIGWRMDPFAVINKAYVVNDRVAFESQLIHSIIESRAPLQKRLRCTYSGEGPTRRCTVTGIFVGETEPHEYESPEIGTIKVQNSPLWKSDPDQQLFYFASRSWARKWAPDVILGVYTKEEMEAIDHDPTQQQAIKNDGLRARLANATRTDEGHRDGYASTELAQLATAANGEVKKATPAPEPVDPDATTTVAIGKRKRRGRVAAAPVANQQDDKPAQPTKAEKETRARAKTEEINAAEAKENPPKGSPTDVANRAEAVPPRQADPGPQPPNPSEPKTIAEYIAYFERWLEKCTTFDDAAARWEGEKEMRDDLAMPISTRHKLEQVMRERFPEVE